MSGGHFYPDYAYHKVSGFAYEVEQEIENNNKEDEYGYAHNYSPEVIEYIKSQIPQMYKVAEIMRAVDFLYAADHGEDSFMKVVKEIEEKYL